RITLLHFSVSSAMSLPKSAGEPGTTSAPSSANRALILGSASAALISSFSLPIISTGVFRGAPTPYHEVASKPGTKSLRAGMSASPSQRVALVTARGRSSNVFHRRRHGREHHLHLTAEQVGERRCRPTIRYAKHIDASHHLEQLAGYPPGVPMPPAILS